MNFLENSESNLTEASKKLEELMTILDRTDQILDTGLASLRSRITSLTSINEALHTDSFHYTESRAEASTALDSRLDDLGKTLESVDKYFEESQSPMSSCIDLSENLSHILEEMMHSQQEIFVSSLSQLSETIDQFLQNIHTSHSTTSEEHALAVQGISQLESKMAESEEQLMSLANSVSSLLDQFSNDTIESIKTSLESVFTSTTDSLNDCQQSSIEQELNTVMDQLGESIDEFSQSCSSLGDSFKDQLSSSFQQCSSSIGLHVEQKLKETFEEAIESTLEAIAKDLLACFLTMQLGSSISGTMLPLIPALKVVGEGLEKLNDTLDFFD